jgi:beta-galactosidase GanA
MNFLKILLLNTLIAGSLLGQPAASLQKDGNLHHLMVDGKPFLMLSGELHNSTSSSLEYLLPKWNQLKNMNLNSVIASISWEQFEPQEGAYDYTLIDSIIRQAEKTNMKVALIWFATWKNGVSTYAPLWVKNDTKRFYRVRNQHGDNINVISPTCLAVRDADAKAYAALMARIRQRDKKKMVIVMQVENEIGCFQETDYSEQAQKLFAQEVPVSLLAYMTGHEATLMAELRDAWTKAGKKTAGTWREVFGDNADAQEFFMAWQYASFVQEVARKGKEQYPLPTYVNAWLKQDAQQPAGKYPCGGPISKVMDFYKAAAPDVDWCAPDIYLPNFREVCAMYQRADNPLFIPESTREIGRAFYAFAEANALCFAPFGIEDANKDLEFMGAYGVLKNLLQAIIQYQGTGKMRGFMRENDEIHSTIRMGDYELQLAYEKDGRGYGLIIQTGPDDFLIAGDAIRIRVDTVDKSRSADVGSCREVRYANGEWVTVRWLNGDEGMSYGFKVYGRNVAYAYTESQNRDNIAPQPVKGTNSVFTSKTELKQVKEPGVYLVKLYTYPKQ